MKQLLCLLLAATIQIQSASTQDVRNYDDLEILERSNFAPDDSTPSATPPLNENPKSLANAQVMMRFGGAPEAGRCACGEACQCHHHPHHWNHRPCCWYAPPPVARPPCGIVPPRPAPCGLAPPVPSPYNGYPPFATPYGIAPPLSLPNSGFNQFSAPYPYGLIPPYPSPCSWDYPIPAPYEAWASPPSPPPPAPAPPTPAPPTPAPPTVPVPVPAPKPKPVEHKPPKNCHEHKPEVKPCCSPKYFILDVSKIPRPVNGIRQLDDCLIPYSNPKHIQPKFVVSYPNWKRPQNEVISVPSVPTCSQCGWSVSEGSGFHSNPLRTVIYKKPTVLTVLGPQRQVLTDSHSGVRYVCVPDNQPIVVPPTEDCGCGAINYEQLL